MANTKKTNTKAKPSAGPEISKNKISSHEMPEQETIETPQAAAEIEKEKGIFGGVAEDIGDGAKMVGKKATELSDMVVDKLKKGWSQAYEAGTKVVDDLSQTAHEYAEKYKAESEIKELKGEKDKLTAQLGLAIFRQHLAGAGFAESFFNKKEIIDQFNQIEKFDKQIINTGKLLDKGKE